ncbi:MAG: class I SAM-dependent methyltransferase [Saprospiraceae bacterium]|nr:class I SAM-dependent methyltransferase [Saprospiraceae bacterium]
MSLIHKLKSFYSHLKKGVYKSEISRLKAVPVTEIEKPPQHLIDLVGGGDYFQIGKLFFTYFIELAYLKPSDRVLDIGCGVGRMAIPLTTYLNKQGSYEGFDIVKELVAWSQSNITPRFPNFHFQLAQIFNSCYNPSGKYKGVDYRFPYPDNEFDFIFLTSVFTHMLPAEVDNYLSEMARTVKPGGRCLVTFFILNDSVYPLIADGKSTFTFAFEFQGCRIDNAAVPEAAVAYDEEKIKDLFKKHDFEIDSFNYGSWSGRKDFLSFQDIVVIRKGK